MRYKLFATVLACAACCRAFSHQVQFQLGRLKQDIAPSADFGGVVYRTKQYRIGAYMAPTARGVVASYSSTRSPFIFEVGQRERSLDHGFVISNGAYLPWTRNFAFAEPAGIRTGYQSKYLTFDTQFYQLEQNNAGVARIGISPTDWLQLSGGVAAFELQTAAAPFAITALQVGARETREGFSAGMEYAGQGNVLGHMRYENGFTLRTLAFKRSEYQGLASGVYESKQGVVGQFFSDHWFAQYFQTDSQFGMLRYAGSYVTGVAVYEQRNQLAGFSVRSSETGMHLRSGATISVDNSLQTLAGLGYSDFIFVGGGHYTLYSDQPLEPVIFPSEWYSSILLQSSSMRVKDQGFKVMALVNTSAVQGFVAMTYSEDRRERERFGFYLRLAGNASF